MSFLWRCRSNSCAALKRLYVHQDQYDEIVKKFAEYVGKIPVGDGLDPKNLIGPVSNKMQLDKVVAYVDDARARGATIVTAPISFYTATHTTESPMAAPPGEFRCTMLQSRCCKHRNPRRYIEYLTFRALALGRRITSAI